MFTAYTQQYTDFNPMIEKNMNGGFTVLAFPCNQFYLQVQYSFLPLFLISL